MSRIVAPCLLALLAAGCPALTGRDVDLLSDQDGDGFVAVAYGGDDCNDRAPTVFPGAPEVCDEFDNDCDRDVNADDDDAVGVEWYRDADHDRFPDQSALERTCADLGGLPGAPWLRARADGAWDCDDQDGDEFPGQAWRFDGDGDGFAGSTEPVRDQCERPEGFIVDVLVENPEPGDIDPNNDCEPLLPTVFPGKRETCNGIDDDCDELVDDAPGEDVQGVEDYFPDDDGDGFGRTDGRARFCIPTAGWVALDQDCDDEAIEVHPGARNIPYNGVDEDCTDTDEDFDQDGFDRDQDCDDTATWINPDAADICDGMNNQTCALYTPAEASHEEGAYFIGPPNPPGTRNRDLVVRGYSDLRTPLGQGDLVTLPGDGTVYLCSDTDWRGRVYGLGAEFVVTSPQLLPARFTSTSYFGTAIDFSAVDVEISNLEIEGGLRVDVASGGTILVADVTLNPDPATAFGSLTLLGGDPVRIRRTQVATPDTNYMTVSVYPEGDLDWSGNQVEANSLQISRDTSATGSATATFGPQGTLVSTVGTAALPGNLTVSGFNEVVLTDVVFADAPAFGPNLTVAAGSVDATNITFGDGTDLRFGQLVLRTYDFTQSPTSFDCAGSGTDACVER